MIVLVGPAYILFSLFRIQCHEFQHMDGSNLSDCDDYLVQVTIKHIILECPNFQEQRIEHFGDNAINMCDVLCDGTSNMEVTFTNISTLFTF